MTYVETVDLATRLARWNAKRKLLEMFVEPDDAELRVSSHEAKKSQDWYTEYGAMFDAIVGIKALGYKITTDKVP